MVERRNLLEAVFAIGLDRSRGAPGRRAFYTNFVDDELVRNVQLV
jgi:hypothetical protein